jgi:hypothetical protein
MWHSKESVECSVCRITCGQQQELDKGTAFLISPNRVITATHNINKYLKDNSSSITLEFLNLSSEPVLRKAAPLRSEINSPITILELDKPVDQAYLTFSNYMVGSDEQFMTFGYPVVKWNAGQWLGHKISRVLDDNVVNPYDWNIDLDHQSNIEDFSGLSGAPVLVDGQLVGIMLTEAMENGKAISLGAIGVKRFAELLAHFEIEIIEFVDPYLYQPTEEEYKDFVFVEKLESANIFDHEMCQKEFFNAEIITSMIKSRSVKRELNELNELKANILSLWHTKFVRYKDEQDGTDLLSSVYERIEDHHTSTLSTGIKINLYAKKGILHQWAEECKVGWVKNYHQKLIEYRKAKRGRLNIENESI